MDLGRLLARLVRLAACGEVESPGKPDMESAVQESWHKWLYSDGSFSFTRSCANLEGDLPGASHERGGFDLRAVRLEVGDSFYPHYIGRL